jgi:D-alanine-D-alanine ligase
VFSFFTSFGYFLDESENFGVAGEIARVLRPGGRLFMDHANAVQVRATLVAESRRKVKNFDVHERRWVDAAARVNKRTVVTQNSLPVAEIDESVRLYEPDEITELLARAGLNLVRFYGDFSGGPLTPDSSRMLILATK